MRSSISTILTLGFLISCVQGNPGNILTRSAGLAGGALTIQSQARSGYSVAHDIGFLTQSPMPHRKLNALTIIVDTSWSCEHEMDDFVSLGRHAISSGLYPGDDLEIISAHVVRPKLRVAQTIKRGDPDEIMHITTMLKGIRSGFLSNARLSNAIEMAFNRLSKTAIQKQYGQVTVIVFSDGRLTNGDAERVLDLAAEFRRKGGSLYLTGNKDTNRKLLVAANQGKLNWSLISQATPAVWLLRQQATSEPAEQVKSVPGPAVERSEPIISFQKDDTAKGSEDENKTAVDDVKPAPGTLPAGDTSTSEELKETEMAPPEKISEPSVTSSADDEGTPREIYWWIVLPAVGLLAFLGLIFYKPIRKAAQWKIRVGSHFKKTPKPEAGILVAELNGQSYRLGRPDRIKTIHIGSGPENTIRVPDKSIQTRHVTVYGRRHDLMLRNVSKSPITLNGSEVKPGGRHRLVFPSVIRLNDQVKLALRLIKQAVTPQSRRSISHET